MHRRTPSASLLALLIATLLVAAAPAATARALGVKTVGEIFVDAQGRAQGQNLQGVIDEAAGTIRSFQALPAGATVFDSIRIDGFDAREKLAGIGSPTLTLPGSNAVVRLHDNLHSVVQIEAVEPATVGFRLAQGMSAVQDGAVVRIERGGETLGSLVAVGAAGDRTRGETLQLKGSEVLARLQTGSELLFLANPAKRLDRTFHDAVVSSIAKGSLASLFVTEFADSAVATSQLDTGEGAHARTRALASGVVETALRARPTGPTILVYELAYETLPARDAREVAVYVDGELAQRAQSAQDLLVLAEQAVPAYHASGEDGRMQVMASSSPGEHRIVVAVSAHASTERQGRAESGDRGDARVYGSFEHHPNGKLTGEFVTAVLPPDGEATLLSLTALASRTEVFRSVEIDGGARARVGTDGPDTMRLAGAKADLTLVDDVHATMMIAARAPAEAVLTLGPGVKAREVLPGLFTLEGPHGPAGGLALLGDGASLAADPTGALHARLQASTTLLYRGAPDAHPSEAALLRALAQGRLGAQLVAGVHDATPAAKATSYSERVDATVAAAARGALDITYTAHGDAPRAFAVDTRGAALVAKAASDVRVLLGDAVLAPSATVEDALEDSGEARYYAATSAEGALRVVVNTAAASGQTVHVTIESIVEQEARAHAREDAFGVFRLFQDGSAIGDFVTLRADSASGAVTALTSVATGRAIFTSLVAGHSPYGPLVGDGASVLKLQNREARLEFSDSTNAFARIHALQRTDAAFRLADGLTAQPRGEGVVEILDEDGRHVASLVASRASSLEARAAGEVRGQLAAGGEILFRTHDGIESELSGAQRAMLDDAMAGGRLAGQVVARTDAANGATSSFTAPYADVEILTHATRERVEITIDSATRTGRTLVVSLDPETIPGMARGHASIRFDGALIGQASSYADVLDPLDDGDVAEYFVLAGDAGTQVLVSIPHFSVHVVTLEQRTGASSSIYLYATIFLGLLVLVESVLLARASRLRKLTTQRRP